MRKLIIVLLSIVVFASCSEKKSTKNFVLTGDIKGLKKGTLYIQRIVDTTLVAIDTIKINGDSQFVTEFDLNIVGGSHNYLTNEDIHGLLFISVSYSLLILVSIYL